MRNILKLNHWVLFTLVIVGIMPLPPVIGEVIKVIASSIIILWTFSVGYYGEQKRRLMGFEQKNLTFFQFNSFYSLIFGNALILMERMLSDNSLETAGMEMFALFIGVGAIYFLFAAIHVVVFSARTLAEVEAEKPVTFSGYFSKILMMLFFAIGVWILQPKVKRYLIEEYDEVNPFESI